MSIHTLYGSQNVTSTQAALSDNFKIVSTYKYTYINNMPTKTVPTYIRIASMDIKFRAVTIRK